MRNNNYKNIIEFYVDPFDETEDGKEFLTGAGIDTLKLKTDVLQFIKLQKKKLKVEAGRKLQREFDNVMENLSIEKLRELTGTLDLSRYSLSFNKLDKLDRDDILKILDDTAKMEILNRLKKK